MVKKTILVLACLCTLICQISLAQADPKTEVTTTFLFKSAMVVDQPGASPKLQCVLIKNGIITQISPTIKSPFDAKVIDVDSMYMYAGFIDPMSYTGIKKEEEKKDAPKPPSRGQANYEQSGITPQINALSKIIVKESSIADMRKAGFTTSHIFPRGKMIGGSSAIIHLKDTDHEDKIIIGQNIAMHSSFTTANGVAPSTVIGVIAKYKDLFKNIDIAIKNTQTYNLNPVGLKKPIFSEELTAMMPVVKKTTPLYFVVEKNKDILRAINLQKELGFKMVLAEVKMIQHSLDYIKKGGYSVLLSMDLPDEIKDEEKKDEPKNLEGKKDEPKTQDEKKDEPKKESKPQRKLSPEQKALEDRKKIAYDEYLSQASLLEKNGILFSFSYLDAKPGEIHKTIKRMIKAGLSETAALAALTTSPAKILGTSNTSGTIETGKIANLVLTDKALFEDKSEIKYVMVDGSLYDLQEKKKTDAKIDDKGAKIAGVWSYSVEVPGSTQTGKLTFEKDGFAYKGFSEDSTSPGETDKMEDIAIDGDKVTFSMTVDIGQPTTVTFDLIFTGDTYKATSSMIQNHKS
jgi:imidazolonepropionase-like amidohydrolase